MSKAEEQEPRCPTCDENSRCDDPYHNNEVDHIRQAVEQSGYERILEQVEEIVSGELGDWGGPERKILDGRLDEILKQVRALAPPLSQSGEKERD